MQPHQEEGEGKYTEKRERSAGRQGRTRGYICRIELGKTFKMQEACGMVRKAKRQEKAKQRRYKYENAPGRCGVLPSTPAL